ncbi:hypothetical protein QE197_24170 (plasmid) [Arsenophonus nasoniae]|uniref:Phage transcriptional regulator n=1 Tax=Arsenophonus nasoniae TaxID=638 RepID=A0ABY8NWZ6_9GAMM|nr:hypothetical protein [Arsenophonus nasoniae]WGM08912.1 hypothetical protein QE258_26490 [Arsenophonus nasoniae]WGM13611.1 hypothetical protein QE197_24170 [Arsenophonus nasoniae]
MAFLEFGYYLEVNNIKNKDVAERLGVKPPMISQWRHDPRVKIDTDTGDLVRISTISRAILSKLKPSE